MPTLAAVESLFEAVHGPLTTPALLFDASGKIVRANPAFAQLTGVRLEEIEGVSTLHFIPFFKSQEFWTTRLVPSSHLTRLSLADGARIPVAVSCSLLRKRAGPRDADNAAESETAGEDDYLGGLALISDRRELQQLQGKLEQHLIRHASMEAELAAIGNDGQTGSAAHIEEQKRLQRQLEESKEFLEDVIETCGDGICITNADGRVVKTNGAFATMLDKSREEIEQGHIYDFWPIEGRFQCSTGETIQLDEAYQERFLGRMERELLRGDVGRIASLEVFAERSDGSVLPVELSMAIRRNTEGVMLGGVGTARDITERRKAELSLREAGLLRERFVTNVTHGLRSPLTLILGPLESVLREEFGSVPDKVRAQLEVGMRSGRQLLQRVNELLDLSRLGSGAMHVRYRQTNLQELAGGVSQAFTVIAESRGITLTLEQEGTTTALLVDPDKVAKVLFNLLENAFKFTAPGGRVEVRLEVAGDEAPAAAETRRTDLTVSVRDTGIGIAPAHQQMIFERFKQAPVQGVGERGSGIGLAHARELAQLMGGDLQVQSEAGVGSTFSLQLPLGQPEPTDTPASPGEQPPWADPDGTGRIPPVDIAPETEAPTIRGERPLLLVVDDEADMRRYIAGLLESSYDCLLADSGDRAVALLEDHCPDLILSDMMMPDMDGLGLLRAVRAMPLQRAVPFIFLSARADVESRVSGLDSGADDYVIKPFNSLELLARIRAQLRLRTLEEQNQVQQRTIRDLSQQLKERHRFGPLVGKSPLMQQVYTRIEVLAGRDAPVLISGETGTGKELAARAIHYASARRDAALVTVNCAAIPRDLMEAEFFGHARGAFTGALDARAGHFEAASGGSLFLDELGEMDREMQAKLLRVLETGELRRLGENRTRMVDVRVIAATNRDLRAEVAAGRFREDLYYRVHVIPLELPPLRARREDLPLLIAHFRGHEQGTEVDSGPALAEADMRALLTHDFPGNVRELKHLLERHALLGGALGELVLEAPTATRPGPDASDPRALDLEALLDSDNPMKRAQDAASRALLDVVLKRCDHNHSRAARALGIARSSLYRKLRDLGMTEPES